MSSKTCRHHSIAIITNSKIYCEHITCYPEGYGAGEWKWPVDAFKALTIKAKVNLLFIIRQHLPGIISPYPMNGMSFSIVDFQLIHFSLKLQNAIFNPVGIRDQMEGRKIPWH